MYRVLEILTHSNWSKQMQTTKQQKTIFINLNLFSLAWALSATAKNLTKTHLKAKAKTKSTIAGKFNTWREALLDV